ncbi:MAG: hydrogenase expression/formation protein [Deltaproteobacteria bacterium]|nr:hydrogenase expression/formation protein [Deltaproteobacteria bacterium]
MKKTADRKLPCGKLPIRLLQGLLKRYSTKDKTVLIKPSIGVDAAVIKFGGQCLVAKTDPVTFVAEDMGSYAININANDIAVMGAVPRWFLAAILLPEKKTTVGCVNKIFKELDLACKNAGVALCGGHTEITASVTRPTIIGLMLGSVKKNNLITSMNVCPGDDLILTKGIAIEGTSIIAREYPNELEKTFSAGFIKRCKGFLKRPGISVVKDVRILLRCARVHAMHDPTEGGLAAGLHELAIASRTGIIVYEERIPVLKETQRLCQRFGLDPMGLIASGALIASVDARDTTRAIKGLEAQGIKAYHIGSVVHSSHGVRIVKDGRKKNLRLFHRDEFTKLFDFKEVLQDEKPRDDPERRA